jgi:glycerophosphoryl diester phosphodiesterase
MKLVAHRGHCRRYAENTGEAFEDALTFPIFGIELDIQALGDGTWVVFHDHVPTRFANCHSPLWTLTLEQWSKLVFRDPHAQIPMTPPTLPEVLERLIGRTHLLIEVKTHPEDPRSYSDLIPGLSNVLAAYPTSAWSLLSFNEGLLMALQGCYPHWSLIWNVPHPETLFRAYEAFPECAGLGLSFDLSQVDKDLLHWLRDRKPPSLWAYPVDDPRELQSLASVPFTGIMTDALEQWLVPLGDLTSTGLEGAGGPFAGSEAVDGLHVSQEDSL